MTKRVRLLLFIILGLLIAVIVTLFAVHLSVQHVPAFYREALHADPEKQKIASDCMVRQAAALNNAFKKEGDWEAVVTAEQLNGWFAVDAAKNHADAVPQRFRNPRVAIDSRYVTVAGLLEIDDYSTVVSLTIEPYMPEPNVLALRIVKARAGLLPVPLRGILERLTQVAHDWQVHLEWRQDHGDPVALLSLPEEKQGDRHRAVIETLRLSDGEIYFAGMTKKGEPKNSAHASSQEQTHKNREPPKTFSKKIVPDNVPNENPFESEKAGKGKTASSHVPPDIDDQGDAGKDTLGKNGADKNRTDKDKTDKDGTGGWVSKDGAGKNTTGKSTTGKSTTDKSTTGDAATGKDAASNRDAALPESGDGTNAEASQSDAGASGKASQDAKDAGSANHKGEETNSPKPADAEE
jgi:hypothetical protein